MNDAPTRFTPAWRTFTLVAAVAVGSAAVAYLPAKTETQMTTVHDASEVPEGAVAAPADDGAGGETRERVVVVSGGSQGSAGTSTGGGQPGTGGPSGPSDVRGPSGPLECAPGKNGGSTDVGVSDKSIKLGATVVDSGVGADFLRDARYGILAVKNRVNRGGGICGRNLEVLLVDDGWDAGLGATYIRNLVEDEKVFALSVVPSSEGLNQISESGYLEKAGVPVVGSDGMLASQYKDDYIWPVAASTVSTMHIVAEYAVRVRDRSKFGLVYDQSYKFGQEGAAAFKKSLERLGVSIGDDCSSRFCGINATATSYSGEIQSFNNACSDCDYIVFLLQPPTALTWIDQGGKVLAGGDMAGPQPLFTREFGEKCKARCHNMWLWTGYIPAIDTNIGRPAVAEFRDAIKKTSSSADVTNTFVEGAYVGMNLLVEALEQVGPALTRERLISALDSMTYDPGLTAKPLSWSEGNHFANTWMQAYSIQYTDRFAGWRDEQVSRQDPWIGEDI